MRSYRGIGVPLLIIFVVLGSGCVTDSILTEDDLETNQIVLVTEYTPANLVGNIMQGHAYRIQLVNGSEYRISKTEYTGLGMPEAHVEREMRDLILLMLSFNLILMLITMIL